MVEEDFNPHINTRVERTTAFAKLANVVCLFSFWEGIMTTQTKTQNEQTAILLSNVDRVLQDVDFIESFVMVLLISELIKRIPSITQSYNIAEFRKTVYIVI